VEIWNTERRLEAFEFWCYRIIMRISWVEEVTKEEVCRRTVEKISVWKNLIKRRYELIGHLLRLEEILKTIIQRRTLGKNYRRKTILACIKQIMYYVGSAGPRHVGAPGKLIIWRPSYRYSLNICY
jgi:hypothetical protein